jgi:hypothetical protein
MNWYSSLLCCRLVIYNITEILLYYNITETVLIFSFIYRIGAYLLSNKYQKKTNGKNKTPANDDLEKKE